VGETLGLAPIDRLAVGVPVPDCVDVTVPEVVPEPDAVGLSVIVGELLSVDVALGVMEGVARNERLAVGVTDSETLSEGVDEGVTAGVGVAVDEGVGVAELERVAAAETLAVRDMLPVLEGDAPYDREFVAVTLSVDVTDDDVDTVVFAV
jgi:hypothetical protein